MKRLLYILITAIILCTALAVTSFAATVVESGSCGSGVTYTLDSDGVLTIKGNGAMTDYSYSSNVPWYSSCLSVKTVVIKDSVTSIGSWAFYYCYSLTSVVIPDSVTSIGYSAFAKCTSLTSVTIPDNVTSIGSWAFDSCNSLTSVTIPDSVTSIGTRALGYYYSSGYKLVDGFVIKGYEGSAAETYANNNGITFEALKKVEIIASGTCGENVTWTLDENGLLTISGSGAMTNYSSSSSVPWYSSRSSVKTVVIKDGVTSIGTSAFYYCDSLTSVTIGNSVTSIGERAFTLCDSLTSVVIPDSVTSIGDHAFYYCDSLTSVTIPDSVTSIGNSAFYDCTSLTGIWVDENNASYSSDANGILYNKDKTTLICCPEGTKLTDFNIPDSVTSIGSEAFYFCNSLTSVTIPDSVTSIGDEAFAWCYKITSATIPDSVTSIGSWAFYSCDSLTGIWVDKNNASYSSDVNGILYNKDKTTLICYPAGTELTDFTIPDGVTSIGERAFSSCDSLTSVTIPDSVTSIGDHAFYYCDSLTNVTIPDSVTSIGDHAFYYCDSLTSVTIPDSVTSIGDHAFYSCDSLTSVTIPDSVTRIGEHALGYYYSSGYKLVDGFTLHGYTGSEAETYAKNNSITFVSIGQTGTCGTNVKYILNADGVLTIKGNGAMTDYSSSSSVPWYSSRSSVKTVVIEDGVTSIGSSAFRDCDSLTSVTIPDSVTSIGSWAFYSCDSLTSVVIPDSVTSIGSYAFSDCSSSFKLYGYTGSYTETYANANGITFVSIIEAGTCGAYITYTLESDGALIIKGSGAMTNYSSSSTPPWYSNRSSVKSVVIETGVTSVGSYALYGCSSLASVTIGNGVTGIGAKSFGDCDSLISVTIPDGVTNIGSAAFRYCSSLTCVIIPESVTSIGTSAFASCSSSFKLYGYTGSYAETYAKNNGITFVALAKIITSGSCGSGVTYTLDSDGVLTISGSGAMTNYSSSSSVPWYSSRSSVKTVVIEDGVTSIGSYAFAFCYSLTSVTIPDSVTSIGSSAFYSCDSLTSVYITDISAWCNIKFSNYSSNPLDNAENLYLNGKLVTDLVIPDSVTSIGSYAFSYCDSLTSVTIPDSVTSIGNSAFYNCDSLTSVTIPDSVTSIGDRAFYSCDSLTSVTIGDSVTSIGSYAFYSCDSLASVTIGDSVTSIGSYAFCDCISLTSVTIPDSVTSIGGYALGYYFDYSDNLIDGFTLHGYTGSAAETYAKNNSITFVDVITSITVTPPTKTEYFYNDSLDTEGMVVTAHHIDGTTKDVTAEAKVDVSLLDKAGSVTVTVTYKKHTAAFEVTVTAKSESIAVTKPTKIEYYYLDSLDTSGMTVIEYYNDGTTKDVTADATVDVSLLDKVGSVTVTVTYKEYTETFDVTVIPKLESVTITAPAKTEYVIGDTLDTSGMTVIEHYNDGSTNDVTSEASVDVTALDTVGTVTVTVTYKDKTASFDVKVYVAMGKLNESIVYKLDSDGYLEITGEGNMPDHLDEFAPWYTYRDDVKRVTVSEGITSIGAYSFFGCSYIEALEIPSTVTVIGESAFTRCFAITSLTLPSGVTSIGAYAFSGCKSLTALEIPKATVEIGAKAFNTCPLLRLYVHEESYGLTYARENSLTHTMISKVREVLASGETGGLIWEFDNFNALTVKGEGAIPNYTRTETAPWYEYRKQITSIIIEDGVTSIGDYAFYNLTRAAEMTIADSVKYLGLQFIRGTAIAELYVNAEIIAANAFGRADNLKTLILGEGFQNALGNIFYSETLTVKAPENSYAYKYIEFYSEKYPDSQAVLTLVADGIATGKVARIGSMGDNAFYAMYENSKGNWKMVVSGTGAMKNFPYYSAKNEKKGYTFCPTHYMSLEGVETKIYAIEVLEGITTVGNYAFYKCTKASSVSLPDGITSIGQGAFRTCAKLVSVTLPETVTKIEANAFNGCTGLTYINLPDAIETLGEDIFIKCNTENITVKTTNVGAMRYLINNYGEITIE